MAISFSDGGSRREPLTLGKQPVNFYHLPTILNAEKIISDAFS
jgi:hypothetical protein